MSRARSNYNAVIYNALHSHQPHLSLSDYSVSAEAVEKPAAQTYRRRSAVLLSSDSPTEHKKPSEKPDAVFFNWKDGLHLLCLFGMLPGTLFMTLCAALVSDCLRGCHWSPSFGMTGWEPREWLSQSCPNPLHTCRMTQCWPNHRTPNLLPAPPHTSCLL